MGRSRPGDQIKLTCLHDGKEIVLDVTLGTVPDTIVDELSGEVIEKPAAVEKKEVAEKPADAKPTEAPKTGRFSDDLAGHGGEDFVLARGENINLRDLRFLMKLLRAELHGLARPLVLGLLQCGFQKHLAQ